MASEVEPYTPLTPQGQSSTPILYPPPMPPHYHLVRNVRGVWKSGPPYVVGASELHAHLVDGKRYLGKAVWREIHTHEEKEIGT